MKHRLHAVVPQHISHGFLGLTLMTIFAFIVLPVLQRLS